MSTKANPLARYNEKRDFSQTPEPSGSPAPEARTERRFVIQMHRATRLHFDFRLEAEGVLKSWAVPKGPSLDPHVRRLAMQVEDHPYDYRDFEGIIPAGNYGAGEVIVWDQGTYAPLGDVDPVRAIDAGELKFEMRGEKLRGAFVLVRMHPRGHDDDKSWLLIKERDDAVDPAWKIEDHLASVKTGKTLADIARDAHPDEWESHRPGTDEPSRAKPRSRKPAASVQPEPPPTHVAPMLATLADAAFDDDDWLFELKWDGYRGIVTIGEDGTVGIRSRSDLDLAPRFPELAALGAAFAERGLVLDGEIAVLTADGRSSFSALQHRVDRHGRPKRVVAPVTYVVFDLLYARGRDMRAVPLRDRKALLESLVRPGGLALYGKHVVGAGLQLDAFAKEHDLEGIVAKRADSAYVGRRSTDWLKIKTRRRQECVVGGWTAGEGRRRDLGALVLGLYEGEKLVPIGSVGSGFDARETVRLRERLDGLARETSPFARKPAVAGAVHWVRPTLVVETAFAEFTSEGVLRQASYVGVRDDKPAKECVREREMSVDAARNA